MDNEDIIKCEDLVDAIEKAQKLIEEGYCYDPKLSWGRLKLYDASKRSKRLDLKALSEEEQKKVLEEVKKMAKEARQELAEQEKGKYGGSGQAGVGRRYTLEQLDRSHAKIVRNLTEATGWFADVLADVGFYATIIAMQHAKVPPEQLYEKVVEFRDPKEFSEFVKDHLAALLEATEDAKALLDLRKQLDIMDAKLILLKEAYMKLKSQRDELLLLVNTAMAGMCDECMKRFLMSWMSFKFGVSLTAGGVGVGQAGGVVSSGDSEEEGDTRGGSEATA